MQISSEFSWSRAETAAAFSIGMFAQSVCSLIRSTVKEKWGSAGEAVRIQYGGSVKSGNCPDLMRQPDIDGALVGGAALDPDEFARIVNYRLVG